MTKFILVWYIFLFFNGTYKCYIFFGSSWKKSFSLFFTFFFQRKWKKLWKFYGCNSEKMHTIFKSTTTTTTIQDKYIMQAKFFHIFFFTSSYTPVEKKNSGWLLLLTGWWKKWREKEKIKSNLWKKYDNSHVADDDDDRNRHRNMSIVVDFHPNNIYDSWKTINFLIIK